MFDYDMEEFTAPIEDQHCIEEMDDAGCYVEFCQADDGRPAGWYRVQEDYRTGDFFIVGGPFKTKEEAVESWSN